MTAEASAASRWRLLWANAKYGWGRLTDDRWLQIEGRRESRATLLEENPAFERNRRLSRPAEIELPVEP